ncbi:WD40-repeat-containing domain protein [Bipolaris maydis]|nr:WD40-repeat-containing domain protein [Bipolaris maydis]
MSTLAQRRQTGHENTLDHLPRAEDAPFNSYARQHEHGCLPDTRVDLLQEIHSWADGQDERCIFWLSGLAGTGKSTIARTVAHSYYTNQRLAASFFFSRGGGDVSHADMFVTSIAAQLADNIPASRCHIREAIAERSSIARQSLRDQWHHLILCPLSKLREARPYILVVDALDECDNDSNIQIIVQLLADVRPSLTGVRLRVLLTSRPEVPIRHGFGQMADSKHKDVVLHTLSPSVVDHDIGVFFEHWLRIIAKDCYYEHDWPGAENIGQLVQSACGLFIWAATAFRFIQEGGQFAKDRLRIVLKDSAVTNNSSEDSTSSEDSGTDDQLQILPEKRLDNIYLTVLKRSVRRYTKYESKKWYALVKEILGAIVLLYSPLSATSLARLLHRSTEEVRQTLHELHSILDVPQHSTYHVRLHHPSFRDFLLNKNRCRDDNLWVEERQTHTALAEKCILLLSSSLKQDICGIGDFGVRAAKMERKQLEYYIPPEMQYACLYWTHHLAKSGAPLLDDEKVHEFLKQHFLHWLEALSWMGKVSEGIYAISSLESIALIGDCPDLAAFIHDMKRFTLYSRLPIELAPLQVYSSALVFAPVKSIVKNQFADQLTQWIKSPPQVDDDWSACLQTLEGHNVMIRSVIFSHDSTRLASVSYDKTAKIWDVRSGECLQTFDVYSDPVTFSHDFTRLASVTQKNTIQIRDTSNAFSHDSMHFASASSNGTIKIWDASNWVCLHKSKIHKDHVDFRVFSHNLMQLATVSKPRTIDIWDTSRAFSRNLAWLALGELIHIAELWDISSGAYLHTLRGHKRPVISLAFSHDSMRLASASVDKTIKIWDTSNGQCLQTYKGHNRGVNSVAFSHDSTQLASASQDETIKIWDASSSAFLQTHDSVSSVSPSQDLMEQTPDTLACQCVDLGGGVYSMRHFPRSPMAILCGSTRMVRASISGTIKIEDRDSLACLKILEGHRGSIEQLAISDDSMRLVSASQDKTVKIWDTSSGACLQTLESYSESPSSLIAFSRDSLLLALAFRDGAVKIWDISSGACVQTLKHRDFDIYSMVFSDESTRLASASIEGTTNIWDINSGTRLQTFRTCGLGLFTDIFTLLEYEGMTRPQQITHCSINISADRTWITRHDEEWLWLPVEYRPGHFVISGGRITVTTRQGKTWSLDFV